MLFMFNWWTSFRI